MASTGNKLLQYYTRECTCLQWFVDAEVAEAAFTNPKRLIQEEVEIRKELIPDAAIDENVDVHIVRKHFTTDAWLSVMDVMTEKSATLYLFVSVVLKIFQALLVPHLVWRTKADTYRHLKLVLS